MKKIWIFFLLFFGSTHGQTVNNGQQIVVGGVRFDSLQIIGQNQNRQPSTWQKQFSEQGVTMALAEDWWWLGSARVEARLKNTVVLVCQTKPLNMGFVFVFVIAQNQTCLADSKNSGLEAQKLETWVKTQNIRQIKALKTILQTAKDAYGCVLALLEAQITEVVCRGVPPEVLRMF
jgi:hypothetical protein